VNSLLRLHSPQKSLDGNGTMHADEAQQRPFRASPAVPWATPRPPRWTSRFAHFGEMIPDSNERNPRWPKSKRSRPSRSQSRSRPASRRGNQIMVTTDRRRYVLVLQPEPGVDPIRALRWILKRSLRQFGMKCVDIREAERASGDVHEGSTSPRVKET